MLHGSAGAAGERALPWVASYRVHPQQGRLHRLVQLVVEGLAEHQRAALRAHLLKDLGASGQL